MSERAYQLSRIAAGLPPDPALENVDDVMIPGVTHDIDGERWGQARPPATPQAEPRPEMFAAEPPPGRRRMCIPCGMWVPTRERVCKQCGADTEPAAK